MSEYYGPALPPGSAPPGGVRGEDRVTGTELPENTTRDKQACNEVEVTAKGNESTCNERPSKPTNSANTYGPTLPPDMRVNIPEASATPSPRVPSLYGSALPPGMEQRPEHGEGSGKGGEGDTERGETAEGARDAKTNLAYEVTKEEEEEEEEEEDDSPVIGPIPIANLQKEQLEHDLRRAAVDHRAMIMKKRLAGLESHEAEAPKREEWMTELPPETKAFGLGPRKFRSRNFDPGDRSVWTDTPADQLKKAQEAGVGRSNTPKHKSADPVAVSARDEKLTMQVEDYNKEHRAQSLVELHRKKRAKEGSSESLRRPFDRERDLQLPHNMITSAKRQALMKDSATSLKTKFSHGSQRFL